MHLNGLGFGGLGMSDTDTLQPGQIVTFTVHGTTCMGVHESDIADTLNNWAGEMMTINALNTTAEGYIPSVVDVQVNATVKKEMPAGDLRGQIIAALNAISGAHGCAQLKDGVLNAAPGGTDTPVPDPTKDQFPWSVAIAGAALFGVILLTGRR